MKIKYLIACVLSIAVLSVSVQPTVNAAPVECPNQKFLTFPAWYRGVVDSECNIKSPSDPEFGGFGGFIWRIGLNLVEIILHLVGYAAVALMIYGGYKYMLSTGSPEGMVAARKTILNAVIGLVISIAAIAIVNTVARGFQSGGTGPVPPDCSQRSGPC